MQLLMQVSDIEHPNFDENWSILEKVEYHAKRNLYYVTWLVNRKTSNSNVPLSKRVGHFFEADKFFKVFYTDAFRFLKPEIRKFLWSQLVTSLWFKAIQYNQLRRIPKQQPKPGELIKYTHGYEKDVNEFTGCLRHTKVAHDYFKVYPDGVIEFDNTKYKFKVPCLNRNLTVDDSVHVSQFIRLLSIQFGIDEIDYSMHDNVATIEMIKERDAEPGSKDEIDTEILPSHGP